VSTGAQPGRALSLNGSMAANTNLPSNDVPAPSLSLAPPYVVDDSVDPDAELVEKARHGDRAAFGVLFQKHHGRIYAMCMRLLKNPSEVDDAVQQTFLEAWRCLSRFEGRSRFTTWVTRVAIHTCFSTRRRLRRLFVSEAPSLDEALAPAWTHAPMPADEVAARRAQDGAVAEVLAGLSSKKRAVFVLADIEGLSSTEIAEILQIPDATVRTRLFHARRAVAAAVRAHPRFQDVLAGRGLARGEAP
jgi:RNA polymerase sigma-70 factor (ECF subfamily)